MATTSRRLPMGVSKLGFGLLLACGTLGCPGGTTLTSFALSEAEQRRSITVPDQAIVEFWAEVDVVHAGISVTVPNRQIPAVFTYAVEIQRTEDSTVLFAKTCNPFDVNVMRWSGKDNGAGEASSREYDGRINDCAVELDAGDYAVLARLEPGIQDDRVQLKTSRLHVRTR